jgi:hypothetical protein
MARSFRPDSAQEIQAHRFLSSTNFTKDSTVFSFLSEFTCLLEALNQASGDVVITGDFNIHVGSGETNADDFEELLVSFSFSQLVKAPTTCAKSGKWYTLDLILTRESSNFVLDASVTSRLSDHHAI